MEKIFAPLPNIISRIESKPLRLASGDDDFSIQAGDIVIIRTPRYEYTVKVRSQGTEDGVYIGFIQSAKGRGTSRSAFFAEGRVGSPVSFHEKNIHVIMPANKDIASSFELKSEKE